jgi:trehalose synthase
LHPGVSRPVPATVQFRAIDPARLAPVIGAKRLASLREVAAKTRETLGGRRVVNINSTATGGGVAELLHVLLGYARGAGVGTDWLVIHGSRDFFATTKRIHNWLYGTPGDRGALDERERRLYEATLAANAEAILAGIRPGDLVVVHDPQPAGLIPLLAESGTQVVWRCHVGVDASNEWTERAWAFLRRYLEPAVAHVFSRRTFAPPFLDPETLAVIAPSIDPFSIKNVQLSRSRRRSILGSVGLISARGKESSVVREAAVLGHSPRPPADAPLVAQISRWDRLKDMGGVLQGFVEHVPRASGAHLVLAGPAFAGVADDPEAELVWNETSALWHGLDQRDQERVHLALIPMDDLEENALVINALQRHSAVAVQKSLAEGFGLTVAEAMWKSRPVVGSAVGGIADQLVDGVNGVLIDDPRDLDSFGRALARLLSAPDERRRLGRNARARAKARFLPDRHLTEYALLIERVLARGL